MFLAQRNRLEAVPSYTRVGAESCNSGYQQSSAQFLAIRDVAGEDQHTGSSFFMQVLKYNFTKLDETLLYKFLKSYSNLKHLELNSCEITD